MTVPRMLRAADVAAYLGLGLSTFYARLPVLRRSGFPAPHRQLRRYDKRAIDRWLDATGGLAIACTQPASPTIPPAFELDL